MIATGAAMSGINSIKKIFISFCLAVLLTSCSSPANQASNPGPITDSVMPADSELSGVHNLLITDAGILLGTHQGVWLQAESQVPILVGSSRFDVMGLAKLGNGLIASGHPAETEEQVGNVGLRGSIDQGKSWTNISLNGQVDFHRLTSSGTTVLGLSAGDGALLASRDSGKTWDTLANPNLFDLVLDPSNSMNVVGATETGPIFSSDGGKTFSQIEGAPLLALLSWDIARLVGISPDGIIYESLDQATSWTKLGSVPGQGKAIAVRGDEIAVLADTNLYYSSDAGSNFNIRLTGIAGH